MFPQLFSPTQEPWLLLGPASCQDAVAAYMLLGVALGVLSSLNGFLHLPASRYFSLPPTLMSNAQSDFSKLADFREGEQGCLLKVS